MKKLMIAGLTVLNILTAGIAMNKEPQIVEKIVEVPVDVERIVEVEVPAQETQAQIQKEEVVEPAIEEAKEVKHEEVLPASTMEIVEEVEEIEVAPEVDNTKIVELKDGSSIVYNIDTNLYTFYPAIMGDWFYEFDNAQHLQWAIETYQEISPQIGKINDIQIQNEWMQEDGDIVVDLSDGSWLVYNIEKNKFAFQPIHMGDWDMEFETLEDMTNAINIYYDIVTNWEE